jgi:glutamate--cysteine ligase
LLKAKDYLQESFQHGYQFKGFEDLELSTQLLLKAAIKRGIEFKILDRDENFIVLKKENDRHYVKQATKTALDSYITALIMENKLVTKYILEQQGIRVPRGKSYRNKNEAHSDFELYQNMPIVIKPKSTNFGIGITIFTERFTKGDFMQAVQMAFDHDNTILLEEFISGKEYRFLVMGDEVTGILHRVPANVMGDGIHSIEQLVADKNKDPLRGKGYRTPLEKINLGDAEKLFLKNQGRSIADIPTKGERIYLRENSNISTGGDSIDYTEEIPDSYKEIAVRSAKAAGAVFCGVDMMIENIQEEATELNYGIIEINFNPAIHIHCYPYKGKNRHADDKILDLLFR